MREIKFRGKRIDDGKWIYGDLLHDYYGKVLIRYLHPEGQYISYEVVPETVEQYTGFKDINDKEIYEKDILEKDLHWSVIVEYEKGCFLVRDLDRVRYNNLILNVPINNFNLENWEVIGNIYENPELLED